MEIDHVHFYVEDALATANWLVQHLGFVVLGMGEEPHIRTVVLRQGAVWVVVSSPRGASLAHPVARFLQHFSPGVGDVVLRVSNLDNVIERAIAQGVTFLQPLQVEIQSQGVLRWCQVAGWDGGCHPGTLDVLDFNPLPSTGLRHTLVERQGVTSLLPQVKTESGSPNQSFTFLPVQIPDNNHHLPENHLPENHLPENLDQTGCITSIDHAVFNVPRGSLPEATDWYCRTLGFVPRQNFIITTEKSALRSTVLGHPDGSIQFPINEPASPNSQIQEFLDAHRGPGIQHLALGIRGILSAIAQLRQQGLQFLEVPPTYYDDLNERWGDRPHPPNWKALMAQQVLVDWQEGHPEALLLQTFTQPIFSQPTFFFELIERQTWVQQAQLQYVQGFGEGNFQALFAAIEREQMKRGSL